MVVILISLISIREHQKILGLKTESIYNFLLSIYDFTKMSNRILEIFREMSLGVDLFDPCIRTQFLSMVRQLSNPEYLNVGYDLMMDL